MAELAFQCLLGVQCENFVMLAADQTLTQNVLLLRNDANKLHDVSDSIVVGLNGDVGECTQFAQYLAKNVQLYTTKNLYGLSTSAVTQLARNTIIKAMHGGTPNMLNILIAGHDEDTGAQLFSMDVFGSSVQVPYASHGLGGYLGLGIIEYFYKPTLTEREVYEIMEWSVLEIRKRLIMNLANFEVKTVSKDGIRDLPSIRPGLLI